MIAGVKLYFRNNRERDLAKRFEGFAKWATIHHGMQFMTADAKRVVIGRLPLKTGDRTIFFHPFDDAAVLDGDRTRQKGLVAFRDMIDRLKEIDLERRKVDRRKSNRYRFG